ncbi:hypothetical protein Cfor_02476 [Coptotermes formosanus]|uniref:Protein NDNF n=1 Tax=Coptotermes formosanus TaxID=36987 RepID=A0A6L2Q4J0_COPFO|nr:hypothetical protein Cfor_02476 [Coptotermes formosanus]
MMLLVRATAALMPLVLLHVCLLVAGEDAADPTPIDQTRTSRFPRFRFNIRKDDIFHDTRVIPVEHQVSAFLYKGETKLFFFLHERDHSPLSLTVTPCTSSLLWSVRYRHQNDTGKLDDMTIQTGSNKSEVPLEEFRSNEMQTFSTETARPGLYILQVSPLERESYVKLYASLQPGGPHPLRLSQRPRLRLQKRQRRKRLTVRWEPSSVDPHLMHYCLVVNTRRYYSTLCEAQGERNGVSPPETSNTAGFNFPREQAEAHKNELASKAARLNASRLGRGSGGAGGQLHEDIEVGCVGSKTSYTLSNLEHGKVYHFNLFAVNRRTNLSFPYGRTTLKYEPRSKPTGLRDGKISSVNLRKMDGRATFKFKVGNGAPNELHLYIMPCGGAVDMELTLKGEAIVSRKQIYGYEMFRVMNPVLGQRYLLRISASKSEELHRISTVEVLATTRPGEKSPLPELPSETQVHEYDSMRKCNSVTVGWIPSPDPRIARYCVFAREDKQMELEMRRPNQCALDSRLKKSDFAMMHCQDRVPDNNRARQIYCIGNQRLPGYLVIETCNLIHCFNITQLRVKRGSEGKERIKESEKM